MWRSRIRRARNALAKAANRYEVALRKKNLQALIKEHRGYLQRRATSSTAAYNAEYEARPADTGCHALATGEHDVST
jgi:hypothetical protein